MKKALALLTLLAGLANAHNVPRVFAENSVSTRPRAVAQNKRSEAQSAVDKWYAGLGL